ncbi:Hypothetical protein GLP15_5012 [Giardia lamblia P15]|uniref:Signal recognition particle receptor subunit beta n=1 Tax=Giardia intestinalis (strain P15) TaxID=658858 RepID=E1EVM4_GIAIA|nr:Hypothetical protein GLP15_5012 [Giardia lamblia P15]
MSKHLAIASILAIGLGILLSVILWRISRMSGPGSKITTIYLCGDSHSGKTKLYYSLISSTASPTSFDTVKTVDGAVYTGCIDSLPGKLLRLCDIPSDQRCCSPEVLASSPAVIIYIAIKGCDNTNIMTLMETHQSTLKLFLILAVGITRHEVLNSVSSFISANQNIDPEDVTIPTFLQVAEVSSVDELPSTVIEAIRKTICK